MDLQTIWIRIFPYGEYTALVRAGKIISDVVSEKRVKKNEKKMDR